MRRNPHVGSDFDDFLHEEKIFDEAQAIAVKRVLAFQLEQNMKKVWLYQDGDGEANGHK